MPRSLVRSDNNSSETGLRSPSLSQLPSGVTNPILSRLHRIVSGSIGTPLRNRYFVQVPRIFMSKARALQNRLSKNGYPAFLREAVIPDKGVWYRVYLGKYSKREDALLAAESAKLNHRLSAVVHQAG